MLTLHHQHARFVLVEKPPGLSCHRDDGGDSVLTLARAQTGLADLHLLHRLDKLTSGLLLLARGADNAALLGSLFARRAIGKFYLARSASVPKKKQGRVSGDMTRSRNGCWKLQTSQTDPAITRFVSAGTGSGGRLFLIKPETGRTHQIRVALKALGSPILGDSRYGGQPADRGYLHAFALDFVLDGERHRFLSPPASGAHWPALPPGWASPWQVFEPASPPAA